MSVEAGGTSVFKAVPIEGDELGRATAMPFFHAPASIEDLLSWAPKMPQWLDVDVDASQDPLTEFLSENVTEAGGQPQGILR